MEVRTKPKLDVNSFVNVLLYLFTLDPRIDKVHIESILYFSDFNYFEQYEEPLIGATYIKENNGISVEGLSEIIEYMEKERKLLIQDGQYVPLSSPDLSDSAKEIVNDVFKKVQELKEKDLILYVLNDIPVLGTKDNMPIPYEAVFYRSDPYSSREYRE